MQEAVQWQVGFAEGGREGGRGEGRGEQEGRSVCWRRGGGGGRAR